MTDRERTARHEGGHACVAIICHVPLDLVTVRRGKGYHGANLLGHLPPSPTRE